MGKKPDYQAGTTRGGTETYFGFGFALMFFYRTKTSPFLIKFMAPVVIFILTQY